MVNGKFILHAGETHRVPSMRARRTAFPHKLLTKEQLDEILKPENMLQPVELKF